MYNKADFTLRKMTENDLEMVLHWRNAEHIRNNMFTNHIISMEEHRNWFNKIQDDPCNHYLIFEKQSVPIGVTYFTNIDFRNRTGYWGFYLGERNLPKGMGTILGYLSLEYAFQKLDIRKLCGEVLEFNIPSIKLFQKLGFVKEGTLHKHIYINHAYEDILLFGMLNEEWKQHKNKIGNAVFCEFGGTEK